MIQSNRKICPVPNVTGQIKFCPVTFVTFIFANNILLTRSHLVVLGSRAVAEYIFHLQELIGAVASDYGESEALWALFQ